MIDVVFLCAVWGTGMMHFFDRGVVLHGKLYRILNTPLDLVRVFCINATFGAYEAFKNLLPQVLKFGRFFFRIRTFHPSSI